MEVPYLNAVQQADGMLASCLTLVHYKDKFGVIQLRLQSFGTVSQGLKVREELKFDDELNGGQN